MATRALGWKLKLKMKVRDSKGSAEDWQVWVLFMLKGIEETAAHTITIVNGINRLMAQYAYDAVGRLVREGDKTYRYGYLDKVLSVTQGDKAYTYDYHVDGQLARADYGNGKAEDFGWDGLALIQRGDEGFVNEPHVGGGNPVVSSKGVTYLNDMLGTTVGAKKGARYSAAALTAFGESGSRHTFYTGKPQVDGLGHAFFFRNYRAGLGKWQTADPLGYPDGWNQLAYCGNGVLDHVDLWGGSSVSYSVTPGGRPSDPSHAGETAYSVVIDGIFSATHTILLKVDITIAYSSLLYASSTYPSGYEVEYTPHNGASGGILSDPVREAVEAHENGHANYVINVICPALQSKMTMIENKWRTLEWTENKVREEVKLAIAEINLNYNRAFHNAANNPTIDWFNSSPEWRLVPKDQTGGIWKWVKE